MHLRTVSFFLLLGLWATGSMAQQVPSVLHYQASLLQDDQQVEGEIGVTARIYDVESGGQGGSGSGTDSTRMSSGPW